MFDNAHKIMLWVVFFAFTGIAFITAIGYTENKQIIVACKIAAWFFLVIAAVLMGVVVWEERLRGIEVMTNWMHEFRMLPDDEARAAVAFVFPEMRYRMKRGMVREMFEDTQVPIEMFRLFLKTSNATDISPQRDWYTKEMPEWAWIEIYLWLVDHNKVVRDSAAGNRSHLWVGTSYQQLMAYWMAGRRVVNMGETPLPHRDSVPEEA